MKLEVDEFSIQNERNVMSKRQPWDYYSALSEDRLRIVAAALLDVYDEVQVELGTELDDNYTRGTTTFGRQKNKIIQLCTSNQFPWLDLRNTSNDLTFSIGCIPFRFFSDDHEKPSKAAVWRRNEQDDMFSSEEDEPIYWRYILEKPLSEDDEASVYVIGASSNQQIVCEWKYAEKVRILTNVDTSRPEAVDISEPQVGLPKIEEDKDSDAGS